MHVRHQRIHGHAQQIRGLVGGEQLFGLHERNSHEIPCQGLPDKVANTLTYFRIFASISSAIFT